MACWLTLRIWLSKSCDRFSQLVFQFWFQGPPRILLAKSKEKCKEKEAKEKEAKEKERFLLPLSFPVFFCFLRLKHFNTFLPKDLSRRSHSSKVEVLWHEIGSPVVIPDCIIVVPWLSEKCYVISYKQSFQKGFFGTLGVNVGHL